VRPSRRPDGPELHCHAMVSAARLAPELSRKSNQVARGRIRQFESDMPSQAVQSLWGVSDAEKYARHSGASGYVTTRSP
jgi:hypothetical protein